MQCGSGELVIGKHAKFHGHGSKPLLPEPGVWHARLFFKDWAQNNRGVAGACSKYLLAGEVEDRWCRVRVACAHVAQSLFRQPENHAAYPSPERRTRAHRTGFMSQLDVTGHPQAERLCFVPLKDRRLTERLGFATATGVDRNPELAAVLDLVGQITSDLAQEAAPVASLEI